LVERKSGSRDGNRRRMSDRTGKCGPRRLRTERIICKRLIANPNVRQTQDIRRSNTLKGNYRWDAV